MKRLNGQPVVDMLVAVHFEMTLRDAYAILAQPTIFKQERALADWLERNAPSDAQPNTEGSYRSHAWETFTKALGETMVQQRSQELKMLAAPAPEPHPADVENL